jgi:hypothetical protein
MWIIENVHVKYPISLDNRTGGFGSPETASEIQAQGFGWMVGKPELTVAHWASGRLAALVGFVTRSKYKLRHTNYVVLTVGLTAVTVRPTSKFSWTGSHHSD